MGPPIVIGAIGPAKGSFRRSSKAIKAFTSRPRRSLKAPKDVAARAPKLQPTTTAQGGAASASCPRDVKPALWTWLTSSIPKTWPLQVLATAAQVSAPRFRPPLNATSAGASTVDTGATEQVAVRLAGAMDMGTDVGKRGARLHEQPAYRARSMLLHLESSLPLPARTSSSVNLRRQSLSEAKTARALLLGVAGLRDRRPQEAVSMKKGKIQSPARCPAQTWLHVSTRSFMRSFSKLLCET